MQKTKSIGLGILVIFLFVLASPVSATGTRLTWDRNPKAFVHGLGVDIQGETVYFAGPGSVEGAIDVPGHTWLQTGRHRVIGLHYNVGPWMAPAGTPWWATGEPYGVLLYVVHGIIAPPPGELPAKVAQRLKARGYVHVHEFVYEDGTEFEDAVVYLKHIAVRKFFFDGGPMAPMSNHAVSPGIDYNFIPNW